jgi:hypothetical protein
MIDQNINSTMAPAEITPVHFPTRTSTTFEVQQWIEEWTWVRQCLPTPQELNRIEWDGYDVFEASREDLQDALERWEWSDEKAKNVVHAILEERTKVNKTLEYVFRVKGFHLSRFRNL